MGNMILKLRTYLKIFRARAAVALIEELATDFSFHGDEVYQLLHVFDAEGIVVEIGENKIPTAVSLDNVAIFSLNKENKKKGRSACSFPH